MDRGNSASSVNRRLSSLRSFYKYAQRLGLVEKNPLRFIKGPKCEKVLPQFVKESDMNKLFDDLHSGETYEEHLARAIVMLFYATGVRLSELVSINDEDLDLAKNELKVTGKRSKQRIIPFGEEMRKTLSLFITKRQKEVCRQEDGLFLTLKGKRISREKVRSIVKEELSKITTLTKKSPHVLRHSFATAMLNNEANLESLRKLLGHESLSTTEIYTHTTFEQLKKVYQNAHPRA